MLRKTSSSGIPRDHDDLLANAVADDGEKGSKLKREKEDHVRGMSIFFFMLCFLGLAGFAKYNRATNQFTHKIASHSKAFIRGSLQRETQEKAIAGGLTTISSFLPPHSIYSQKVEDANGDMTTVTYEQLAVVQQKFEARGFSVLAFPTNDFNQELGSNGEISTFVAEKFPQVNFPIFGLSSLQDNPVYQTLKQQMPDNVVQHNFFKYLVDENGMAVHFYSKRDDPLSFEDDIEALLVQMKPVKHKVVTE